MRPAALLFLLALSAGPALAQNAAPAPGERPYERDFSPFLQPGFDDGRRAPRGLGDTLGEERRGVASSTEFGFEALMTPGARGSKRSLQPRARGPFDPPEQQ